MTAVARSVFVFGIYVAITGLLFLTVPNLALAPIGFAEAHEPWIRVVGVVVLTIGGLYIQAARTNLMPFLRWTVWTRLWVLVSFTVLAVTGLAEPMLVVFGVIDAAGAGWTAWELVSCNRSS